MIYLICFIVGVWALQFRSSIFQQGVLLYLLSVCVALGLRYCVFYFSRVVWKKYTYLLFCGVCWFFVGIFYANLFAGHVLSHSLSHAEVGRAVRYVNVLFGLIIALVPFVFSGASTLSIYSNCLFGLALVALSVPRGEIRERYGELEKWIF